MAGDWSVARTTRTLLPLLLVLTVLEVGGGLALGSFERTLLRYPTLLVLVPVTIGTAGNLGSVLASRISTAFHLGLLSIKLTDAHLLGNAITTVLLTVSVFPLVGVGAWLVTMAASTPRLGMTTVVGISLASGLVLAAVVVLVTVATTYVAYRLELDPDEVVVPVVTNVCDVFGVVVLVIIVIVTLGPGGVLSG